MFRLLERWRRGRRHEVSETIAEPVRDDDGPVRSTLADDPWRRSLLHEVALADSCFFEFLLISRRP